MPVAYAVVRWNDPQRTPESISTRPPTATETGARVPAVLVVLNQSSAGYVFYDCHANRVHIANPSEVVVDRVRLRSTSDDYFRKLGLGCGQP
jgi:hypothetical protein